MGGLRKLAVFLLPVTCSLMSVSCSDYFEPEVKGEMSTDDYITEESQVFKGMLGIMSCVQQAGDQAIFLTDTRMNILETTNNAPLELKNLYNYESTDGNAYADPTCYYKIIIACNDYIYKMNQFIAMRGGKADAAYTDSKDLEKYRDGLSVSQNTAELITPMISSAIRFKVWAYLMLGKIYGEAYWFDDPLQEKKELTNTEVFTHCDMQQLTEKCLALLENGIDVQGFHVASDEIMQWNKWLDTQDKAEEKYRDWQYTVPSFIILKAELLSWRCNYKGEDEAKADWMWIRDNLLELIFKAGLANYYSDLINMKVDGRNNPVYGLYGTGNVEATSDAQALCNTFQPTVQLASDADNKNAYYELFWTEGTGNRFHIMTSVLYDFAQNQTNRIVQYFCPEYPGDGYYLQPSQYAINTLYSSDDIRSFQQKMVMNEIAGQPAVSKYYYAYSTDQAFLRYKYLQDDIFKIEPSIPLFRGHDIQFLIAEAENHLGNYEIAQVILNGGFMQRFPDGFYPDTWEASDYVQNQGWSKYYGSWFAIGRGPDGKGYEYNGYKAYRGGGNIGILGAAYGGSIPSGMAYPEVKKVSEGVYTINGVTMSDMEVREAIDWQLANEHSKEYLAEGKSYSYLCKMVERWSNGGRGNKSEAAGKMADIIAPKYQATGNAGKVRASILNKHFIDWNLNK